MPSAWYDQEMKGGAKNLNFKQHAITDRKKRNFVCFFEPGVANDSESGVSSFFEAIPEPRLAQRWASE
jgi:hypothetical protein